MSQRGVNKDMVHSIFMVHELIVQHQTAADSDGISERLQRKRNGERCVVSSRMTHIHDGLRFPGCLKHLQSCSNQRAVATPRAPSFRVFWESVGNHKGRVHHFWISFIPSQKSSSGTAPRREQSKPPWRLGKTSAPASPDREYA